ncbi:MAG: SH3 domain-containing protein, partial [Clostridia bacterium]|nr:SH3 domain-containing protein [Clostridia bacterium]
GGSGGSGGGGGSTTAITATLTNPNGGSIVNFREKPGLNTRILAEHRVGKTVTVLGYYNVDWAQVSIDGVTGFVSRHFLRL